MMRSVRRTQGFTLLEVLVALAIVSVALAALVRTGAQTTDGMAYLERRTFAHWVAMNEMAELQATGTAVAKGRSDGVTEMAGIEWRWQREIKATPDPRVLEVEFSVGLEDEPGISQLSGFLPSGN